jgi:ribonuclease D
MVEYITDTISLGEVCDDIKCSTNIIALDTEFMRKHTYYPVLCLIQISYFSKKINDYRDVIIDVINNNIVLDSFFSILNSGKIKKIIHSFDEDITVFYSLNNKIVNNVDDTQIMAEFCGYKSTMGYVSLVNEILNMEFTKNKNTQQSDWKKRPLTQKQLNYATMDVRYLIPLYNALLEKVKKCGNYNYYLDEIRHTLKFKKKDYIIENSWKKIKFILHKKNLDYVLLVRELCRWREKKAIENNVIRTSIIDDETLKKIASLRPKNIEEFKITFLDVECILNMKKSYRQEIVDIVSDFDKIYRDYYSDSVYYSNEKGFMYEDLLKKLYSDIIRISEKLNISSNRAINKSDIISILMKYEYKKNILYGWKKKIFGNLFCLPSVPIWESVPTYNHQK